MGLPVALDVTGFTRRTVMPSADVGVVTTAQPGFLQAREATIRSWLYSRLRKRYAVPFGLQPPALLAQGTNPPGVALQGMPAVGSYLIVLQITTPGALGVAVFQWSLDGGNTWTAGVVTAPSVALGTTGLTAIFPTDGSSYTGDNVYSAETPVPEVVLNWLTAILTPDMYRKRGVNPQDPQLVLVEGDRTRALEEIKEAADSQNGLFDLPLNELTQGALSSAVSQGGPLGYAEAGPYEWTTKQAEAARGR